MRTNKLIRLMLCPIFAWLSVGFLLWDWNAANWSIGARYFTLGILVVLALFVSFLEE